MANYNPFYPSLKIGDVVDYAYNGENFGYGCVFIKRVVGINSPEYGVYSYTLQSTMPNSKPFIAHPSQVIKKNCDGCKWRNECPNIN